MRRRYQRPRLSSDHRRRLAAVGVGDDRARVMHCDDDRLIAPGTLVREDAVQPRRPGATEIAERVAEGDAPIDPDHDMTAIDPIGTPTEGALDHVWQPVGVAKGGLVFERFFPPATVAQAPKEMV